MFFHKIMFFFFTNKKTQHFGRTTTTKCLYSNRVRYFYMAKSFSLYIYRHYTQHSVYTTNRLPRPSVEIVDGFTTAPIRRYVGCPFQRNFGHAQWDLTFMETIRDINVRRIFTFLATLFITPDLFELLNIFSYA